MTVQEYIENLTKPYIQDDNAYFITAGVTRLKCYALYIKGNKTKRGYKALLKKGSIIRTLEDFCSTPSIMSRYKRRILIKTEDITIDGKLYCIVAEDFECTSETEAVALSALVSTVGSYSFKLKASEGSTKVVAEAEHSITSDTSSETEALSEKALKQVSDMIDTKLNEKNSDLDYTYIESKPYINKTLEFNNIKLQKAIETLNSTNLLYITGKSGSGKTFLTKEIAGKLCNIDLTDVNSNNEDFECYHNCLWVETERIDTNEFKRLLVKFCIHNEDSENCLIVFNEASKTAFSKVFPLWDRIDEGGISFKERLSDGLPFDYNEITIKLPKSLKMLSVIADDQYDSQMKRRFKTRLNLNEFSEAEYEEISVYTGIEREIIDILFEFQVIRCEQASSEEHRMKRAFIVPYELKKSKITELENYLKDHLKAVGPEWEEKRNIVKNYIEELKRNEIQ